jgi:hypothetical protein
MARRRFVPTRAAVLAEDIITKDERDYLCVTRGRSILVCVLRVGPAFFGYVSTAPQAREIIGRMRRLEQPNRASNGRSSGPS